MVCMKIWEPEIAIKEHWSIRIAGVEKSSKRC